jgi:hypothetical protein
MQQRLAVGEAWRSKGRTGPVCQPADHVCRALLVSQCDEPEGPHQPDFFSAQIVQPGPFGRVKADSVSESQCMYR